MTLRHVAMFRFDDAVDADRRAAAVAALRRFGAEHADLGTLSYGVDVRLAATNWDAVAVCDFTDVAAYERYRDHPAHRALLTDVLSPVLADRAAVQYRL